MAGLVRWIRQCKSVESDNFDAVGWATETASGLQKVGCWFAGVDDLTGALRAL